LVDVKVIKTVALCFLLERHLENIFLQKKVLNFIYSCKHFHDEKFFTLGKILASRWRKKYLKLKGNLHFLFKQKVKKITHPKKRLFHFIPIKPA